jgi:hypothetical protein
MNAKQAIDKIAELLKLSFKSEKFFSTKLTDGTEVTNNLEEDFKIGQVLYVVGESTLTPAPAGEHITREGLKLTVDTESVIVAIEEYKESDDSTIEEEAGKMEMTRAEDAQGQILESPTFDVGEKVELVKEDGSMEPAPNGEHQVVLKDESGNENKIRIQVKDGIIVERSNVEEMAAMEEGEVKSDIEKLIDVILPMVEEMKKMKSDMASMKEKMEADMSALTSDFSKFKKSPEKFSVVEKKTYKESLDDYKLDIIKAMRK